MPHITTNSPQNTTQKTPFLPTPLLKTPIKQRNLPANRARKKIIENKGLG
jgi:hypothetical protein